MAWQISGCLWLLREEVLERAWTHLRAVPTPPPNAPPDAGNRPIAYRLDTSGLLGGDDPREEWCGDWSFNNRTMTADCIGFLLHVSGVKRWQPGYRGSRGEWLNCVSLLDDAASKHVFCRQLLKGEKVAAGDWLLTDDHCGLIIRPATRVTDVMVMDCSPRHGRHSAIGVGYPWSEQCQVLRPLVYWGSR